MSVQDEVSSKENVGLGSVLAVASLAFVVAVLLAPLTVILAVPVLIGVGVHHSIAMARTTGSPVPFAVLLALDIIMLVVVVGSALLSL
ncbi:hypothetical protein ACXR2W_10500 [Leucobacter sp. HY1908]